jgi:hypothetical protein
MNEKLIAIVVLLIREVAELRGQSAALIRAVEELRTTHPELDGLNLRQACNDARHDYLSLIEAISPELAALADNRREEDF